jgi:hypothetical protein
MNTKILAMCVVALLSIGGIGMLAAKPLASVTGTAVLARGNVPVDDIGVDYVGYRIHSGTFLGAVLVGVYLSFTTDIPANTMIFVSVRNGGGTEIAYDAGYFGPISAGTNYQFDLWTTGDVDWATYVGSNWDLWPGVADVNYFIVTVAGNSVYVT